MRLNASEIPVISVIIPVFNERAQLPFLLERIEKLNQHLNMGISIEWIFVDGGSADRSEDYLRSQKYNVFRSELGRAAQMNFGAEKSRGEWLVFLHADSIVESDFFNAILQLPLDADWGHGVVKLDDSIWVARWVERGIAFRSWLTGVATGDQTFFVKRSLFNSLGGYANQPLMEDVDLSRRLNRYGSKAVVQANVITSSRKWRKHGYLYTITFMWFMQLSYVFGVSPERLYRWYYGRRFGEE